MATKVHGVLIVEWDARRGARTLGFLQGLGLARHGPQGRILGHGIQDAYCRAGCPGREAMARDVGPLAGDWPNKTWTSG